MIYVVSQISVNAPSLVKLLQFEAKYLPSNEDVKAIISKG